jgi:hypothetical protein
LTFGASLAGGSAAIGGLGIVGGGWTATAAGITNWAIAGVISGQVSHFAQNALTGNPNGLWDGMFNPVDMARDAALAALGYGVTRCYARYRQGAWNPGAPPEVVANAPESQPGIVGRLAAGAREDVNGLTVAGRALEKHRSRAGSAFPQATGNVAAKNAQGQQVLEDLLRSNNQRIVPNRFGGQDIFDINAGRGARFDGNGNMMGFLEP